VGAGTPTEGVCTQSLGCGSYTTALVTEGTRMAIGIGNKQAVIATGGEAISMLPCLFCMENY
jgi:hypothetical protein